MLPQTHFTCRVFVVPSSRREREDRTAIKQKIGACGREKGPQEFRPWTTNQSPLDLTVYSGGSMGENDNTGAGFCVYRGLQEIARGQVPLGQTAEVYDAEVEAALAGLKAASSHYMGRFATKVTVCLDNQEAALRLHPGTPTDSSAAAILEFQASKHAWHTRERAPNAAPGTVDIRWCPGHAGIPGNELADQLAKAACQMPTDRQTATIARARRLLVALRDKTGIFGNQIRWAEKLVFLHHILRIDTLDAEPNKAALLEAGGMGNC